MLACYHAKDRDLKLVHARRVVEIRYERGEFPEIALMDDLTLEALALSILKTMEKK